MVRKRPPSTRRKKKRSEPDQDPLENYVKNIEHPFINETNLACDTFAHLKQECTYSVSTKKQKTCSVAPQIKEDIKNEDDAGSVGEADGLNPLSDEDDSADDDKALSEWLTKNEIEKDELFSFCCQFCSAVYNQEEEIINHVKEQHPDKADLIPRTQSATEKKVKTLLLSG